MTEEKALELFKNKHDNLTPTAILDCGKYFVINAYEKSEDELDTLFFVMKNNSDIGGFNPTDDLVNFTNPKKVTKLK